MTKTQKDRVLRRAIVGSAASIVLIAILLWAGYAMVQLITGLDPSIQRTFWYWIGGFILVITFGFGMTVDKIAVRSWDTWLDDMGATEIAVFIERLKKRKEHLEKEEEK